MILITLDDGTVLELEGRVRRPVPDTAPVKKRRVHTYEELYAMKPPEWWDQPVSKPRKRRADHTAV